jgi:hypothetical protein
MKKVIVHEFSVGDVDDPEIYAAIPLYDFECSEKGQWVLANTAKPIYWRVSPYPFLTYSIRYVVVAEFAEPEYTYWMLRWGLQENNS